MLCSTSRGAMVPVKALSCLRPNVPDHILSLISVSHVTLHPLSLQGGSATPTPVVSKLQPTCDFVWFPRVQCRVHTHGILNVKVDHSVLCVMWWVVHMLVESGLFGGLCWATSKYMYWALAVVCDTFNYCLYCIPPHHTHSSGLYSIADDDRYRHGNAGIVDPYLTYRRSNEFTGWPSVT